MTNQHLYEIAERLGVELRLIPEMPPEEAVSLVATHRVTGEVVELKIAAPGAVSPEGYFATLHELGHADWTRNVNEDVDDDTVAFRSESAALTAPATRPSPGVLRQEAHATRYAMSQWDSEEAFPHYFALLAADSYFDAATDETLRDPRSLPFTNLVNTLIERVMDSGE